MKLKVFVEDNPVDTLDKSSLVKIPAIGVEFKARKFMITEGYNDPKLSLYDLCIGHIRLYQDNGGTFDNVPEVTDKDMVIEFEENPSPMELFNEYHRMSAIYQNDDPREHGPELYAQVCKDIQSTMRGQILKNDRMPNPLIRQFETVRVTLGSSMGDYGISRDLTRTHGYEHRVPAEDLYNFRRTPDVQKEVS